MQNSMSRRFLRVSGSAAILSVLSGAAFGAAPEIRIEPLTLSFGAGAASSAPVILPAPNKAQAVWGSLAEKAESRRTVRVIVQLAAPFSPEGRLVGAESVSQQRQAIDAAQDSTLRRLAGTGARVHARFELIPFLALEVDRETIKVLSSLPEVIGVEEDVAEPPLLASSNPVIGSGVAWAHGLTGSGQVIAVLDTGVAKTHPFFSSGGSNKVVAEACYSSNTADSTSLCPGGAPESTAPGSGANCPAEVDGCDHGTHVAGIVAGHDGVGPDYGVARGAQILSIQVFSRFNESVCFGGPCALSFISDQIKALERVYELADELEIAAVNMSLGSGSFSDRAFCDEVNLSRKAAIDNLRSIDIATIISSGNEGSWGFISAPACISSAVSVGATDDSDEVAFFSNVASFLDLLAPGVSIDSSVPGGGVETFDGTSMAAPHVAGAWAVLKQASPSATVDSILASLRDTAVTVSHPVSPDLRRINLARAAATGPLSTGQLTIHNDGNAVLSVLSMQLDQVMPWIRWFPEAPFDVAPGGSRRVTVSVDFSLAPAGLSTRRLLVTSTDGDESPYPDGVFIVVDKQACHVLTRSRTGLGGTPQPTPASSAGCPAGRYYAGEVIQLAAKPAPNWNVQNWSGTINDASNSTTNSVTMPAGDHTVAVAYFSPCHALARTHTGSGSEPAASPANSPGCPAGEYHPGELIQLTASPTNGWRIGSWSNTNNDLSRARSNAVTMPAAPHTVAVTYLEGLVPVLLVDDDDNSPDVLPYYTAALDGLGVVYDIWNTQNSDAEPDTADLDAYSKVFWFSGDEFGGFAGPGETGEAALAGYLDGGGCLLLSAQDYLFDRGLTNFMTTYLGVGAWSSDVGQSNVTGQGPFAAVGTQDLLFEFSNFSDLIAPDATAQVAFLGDAGSAAVFKRASIYRTAFFGFPLEALPTGAARTQAVQMALQLCDTVFEDVLPGHWAKPWIEALRQAGITSGCSASPSLFCPDGLVTREQMAVFLLKAKEGTTYTPPPCTSAPFFDVPAASPFCPWIQELTQRGVTGGCGSGLFCPGNTVTRDQMAVFLLAAKEAPGYAPPVCTAAPFLDVPAANPFCPWVQELVQRGVTGGCGSGLYCPGSPSTRAQMAVFLVTNFGIPLRLPLP